uniref:Fibronectin type-III domain-containing protein n=1 Tax=Globisporangium ultimum (strain ATCC 200006 / CBS 805.95 / DAOM BR144) TaxID=431595 RepID=K3W6S7_GLOUD
GLPIATYNIFIDDGSQFTKLTSVTAQSAGDSQTATIYRDLDGTHLSASTVYTFKVLALQLGAVCEKLSSSSYLESDSLTVSTTSALLPTPPTRPSLLTIDGCSVSLAVVPPDDFNGAVVSSYSVRIASTDGSSRTVVVNVPLTALTIGSLTPFSNYSATVSISCDIGNTGYGELLWFTTGASRSPSKLAELRTADIRSSSVALVWRPPEDTGGGYIVYQRNQDESIAENKLIYNGSTNPAQTTLTLSGLLASS